MNRSVRLLVGRFSLILGWCHVINLKEEKVTFQCCYYHFVFFPISIRPLLRLFSGLKSDLTPKFKIFRLFPEKFQFLFLGLFLETPETDQKKKQKLFNKKKWNLLSFTLWYPDPSLKDFALIPESIFCNFYYVLLFYFFPEQLEQHTCRMFLGRRKPTSLRQRQNDQNTLKFGQKYHFYTTILARRH